MRMILHSRLWNQHAHQTYALLFLSSILSLRCTDDLWKILVTNEASAVNRMALLFTDVGSLPCDTKRRIKSMSMRRAWCQRFGSELQDETALVLTELRGRASCLNDDDMWRQPVPAASSLWFGPALDWSGSTSEMSMLVHWLVWKHSSRMCQSPAQWLVLHLHYSPAIRHFKSNYCTLKALNPHASALYKSSCCQHTLFVQHTSQCLQLQILPLISPIGATHGTMKCW